MVHIVLLGDSVFDNGPYVPKGQEVTEKLRARLGQGWTASLLARDDAVLAGVRDQAARLPPDATHLVVSAGGNDALGFLPVLSEPVRSVAEALGQLAAIRHEFGTRYRAMLDHVASLERPTAICTIYDVRFPEPDLRETANAALELLNDVITREAVRRGLPILDLRVLLDEDTNFANPIEPSSRGGEKLAAAIVQVVGQHDFSRALACLYPTGTGL